MNELLHTLGFDQRRNNGLQYLSKHHKCWTNLKILLVFKKWWTYAITNFSQSIFVAHINDSYCDVFFFGKDSTFCFTFSIMKMIDIFVYKYNHIDKTSLFKILKVLWNIYHKIYKYLYLWPLSISFSLPSTSFLHFTLFPLLC